MKRRAALKLLGSAGALGLMSAACSSLQHNMRRGVDPIGLQLYTIRELMGSDASRALAEVAQVGYKEVETAGTGNLNPVEFAQALKNEGLTAPSAHLPINLLMEKPDELLQLAQTIGYRYIVVPWLPTEMRTLDGYAKTIDTLNSFGAKSIKEGVQVAYHNHDFEFEKIDGEIVFNRMLKECDRELVKFELDLFWAAHAGVNAKSYLASDPQRYPLCHVKDRTENGDMVDVGQGEIDFPDLFSAGSGLQHYFVEHDRPSNPMSSIKRSYLAVKSMQY